MSEKYLARIGALLRKAEATDNEHEADAYLQAAQRLATLTSVDLAVARAHSADKERRKTPTMREVVIGESGKRGLRTYASLFLEIARANNLTCDIARDSTKVYAYGFDTDIDSAQALYSLLVVQMVRASDTYIKSGTFAQEKTTRQVPIDGSRRYNWRTGGYRYDYTYESKPVHATTARINFQLAFAARIGVRLNEAHAQAEQQAVAADAGTGVALVLRAREVELADHYKTHSTARGSWAGARARSGYSELSQRAGDQAGRRARLGAQQEIGGARSALPRSAG